ncbi:diguanylate cyclase [Acidobacteria bacterium AB60]|nr:diguanylate cyclase [Acidobacteria bacterium AB60]
MNRGQRILAFITVIGLLLLFVWALLISYQFQAGSLYADQAEHSRRVLVAMQNLNRGLMKAESGQRGFLLTSKPGYSDSYLKGVAASRSGLVEIGLQLGDNKAEQEQFFRLNLLVQAKLRELNQTVELERAHKHSEALAIVQSDLGLGLMDQIQQISSSLLDTERANLGARSSAIQAARLLTGRLFRRGLIGMALLFITTAFLIWRSVAAQRTAMQALKCSEGKLAEKERMLRTITDNLPVLISYIDKNEVVRFSNLTYKAWLNRDPSETVGCPLMAVMGPKMYEKRRGYIQNVLAGNLTEFQDDLELPDGPHCHQVTYVPDLSADGRVAGFFAMTMDITALKRVEAQLEQLARYDILTGLPNRRYFEEKLAEFLLHQESGPFAMMFLDIDDFKAINDGHGHAAGDAALKHFTECLKKSVRATDTVARLAGDEFVVLLPGLRKKADAKMIANKIIQSTRLGFEVKNKSIRTAASIGIAYARAAFVNAEVLFASADRALYAAKSEGGNSFKLIECSVIEMTPQQTRRRGDAVQSANDDFSTTGSDSRSR